MLKPIPERKEKLIIKNLTAACKDIKKLNGTGYGFIHLASGFIAHYDIHGFKDHYSRNGTLLIDMLRNKKSNQWNNFHHGEENYEYYMQKKRIYNLVLAGITDWIIESGKIKAYESIGIYLN